MVVLRKSYGLGALAMATSLVVLTKPFFDQLSTGEFAGMGLEGMIKLGRRSELAAIEDISERKYAMKRQSQTRMHGQERSTRRRCWKWMM